MSALYVNICGKVSVSSIHCRGLLLLYLGCLHCKPTSRARHLLFYSFAASTSYLLSDEYVVLKTSLQGLAIGKRVGAHTVHFRFDNSTVIHITRVHKLERSGTADALVAAVLVLVVIVDVHE